jgi:electron transfer flavoprotein beta subunit
VKVVVCVKQAARLEDEIEFVDDGRALDPDFLEWGLNEWDSFAVEEALRLRDAHGGEVVVVSAGEDEAGEALRRCLAMGADRAVRVWSDALAGADPVVLARALACAVRAESPDLVLCGVQSADAVQGATGGALAGALGLPVVAVVVAVELDGRTAVVRRELEGGLLDVVEVDLPAVLTIQTGINEPRYVTMRSVQEARGAEIALVEPDEVGPAAAVVRALSVPERRRAETIAGGAAAVAGRIAELVREAAPR